MFSGQVSQVGTKSGYSLSEDALRALQSGDTQALIDSHRDRFAGWRMEKDDDEGDDDDDSGDGDDDSGDSGSGDDKKNKGDDDDDDTGGDDDDDDTKAALLRMEKRMKAADKRASDAEARLRKIDDSKKDDLTKAQDRVTELESEGETKDATITGLRLENAFLTSNKHAWHKPGAALRLAQSEGYFDDLIGDDGKIDAKGMEKALDKLAKDNDYLIKRGGGSGGGDDGGGGSGSSGSSAGGRSKNGKDDKQVDADDRRRAPALRRR